MKKFMWVDETGRLPDEKALAWLERLNTEFDDSGESGYAFVFAVPPFADAAEQADQSSVALVLFNDGPTGHGSLGLYEEIVGVWEWPQYPSPNTAKRRKQTVRAIKRVLLKMLAEQITQARRERRQWLFRMSVARVQAERERHGLPIGGSTSTEYIRVMRQFDAMKAALEAKTASIEAQIRSERDALAESSRVAAEMAKQRRQYTAANPGGIL